MGEVVGPQEPQTSDCILELRVEVIQAGTDGPLAPGHPDCKGSMAHHSRRGVGCPRRDRGLAHEPAAGPTESQNPASDGLQERNSRRPSCDLFRVHFLFNYEEISFLCIGVYMRIDMYRRICV